jgi:hypothetical protein
MPLGSVQRPGTYAFGRFKVKTSRQRLSLMGRQHALRATA